jgi:hypothetical protein
MRVAKGTQLQFRHLLELVLEAGLASEVGHVPLDVIHDPRLSVGVGSRF